MHIPLSRPVRHRQRQYHLIGSNRTVQLAHTFTASTTSTLTGNGSEVYQCRVQIQYLPELSSVHTDKHAPNNITTDVTTLTISSTVPTLCADTKYDLYFHLHAVCSHILISSSTGQDDSLVVSPASHSVSSSCIQQPTLAVQSLDPA